MSQSLSDVKIKLSRKDSRVVTLLIFLEFFSRSIMQMTDKESNCFTHVRLPGALFAETCLMGATTFSRFVLGVIMTCRKKTARKFLTKR